MNRHAILILAHNEFNILHKIIEILDHERVDIFIHIDSKVSSFDFDYFRSVAKKSVVYFTDKRIDVRWGDISGIDAEIQLFMKASQTGKYHYYHFVSGVDMPLKTPLQIIETFSDAKQQNFIEFDEVWDHERVTIATLFTRNFRAKGALSRLQRQTDKLFRAVQRFFRYNHVNDSLGVLKKGANWTSLTDDCVRYILKIYNQTRHHYKFSKCGDEVYKQTIIFNSEFRSTIVQNSCREIDWMRGSPYVYKIQDVDLLIRSENIFARKFCSRTNGDIINHLYHHLMRSKL